MLDRVCGGQHGGSAVVLPDCRGDVVDEYVGPGGLEIRRKDEDVAIIARGRIEDANGETYTFGESADYILAEQDGYDLIYLLRGDSVDLAPHKTAVVEVRGEVVGTEPLGKYEILAVESVDEIDDPER